jgi:hypothetical protein
MRIRMRGGRSFLSSRCERGGSRGSIRNGSIKNGNPGRGRLWGRDRIWALDRRRRRRGGNGRRRRRGRRWRYRRWRLGHLDRGDLRAQGDRFRRDKTRRALDHNRGRRLGRNGLVDNRLGRRWGHGRASRGDRFGRLLARQDGLEGIAGLGDLGEIDLGAELFAAGAIAVGGAAGLMEILAYFFGFIDFDGAGVGLFLRDADFDKHVEDLFAFHFQLASQIVNSNLHPPFISLCLNRLHMPERCGCASAP